MGNTPTKSFNATANSALLDPAPFERENLDTDESVETARNTRSNARNDASNLPNRYSASQEKTLRRQQPSLTRPASQPVATVRSHLSNTSSPKTSRRNLKKHEPHRVTPTAALPESSSNQANRETEIVKPLADQAERLSYEDLAANPPNLRKGSPLQSNKRLRSDTSLSPSSQPRKLLARSSQSRRTGKVAADGVQEEVATSKQAEVSTVEGPLGASSFVEGNSGKKGGSLEVLLSDLGGQEAFSPIRKKLRDTSTIQPGTPPHRNRRLDQDLEQVEGPFTPSQQMLGKGHFARHQNRSGVEHSSVEPELGSPSTRAGVGRKVKLKVADNADIGTPSRYRLHDDTTSGTHSSNKDPSHSRPSFTPRMNSADPSLNGDIDDSSSTDEMHQHSLSGIAKRAEARASQTPHSLRLKTRQGLMSQSPSLGRGSLERVGYQEDDPEDNGQPQSRDSNDKTAMLKKRMPFLYSEARGEMADDESGEIVMARRTRNGVSVEVESPARGDNETNRRPVKANGGRGRGRKRKAEPNGSPNRAKRSKALARGSQQHEGEAEVSDSHHARSQVQNAAIHPSSQPPDERKGPPLISDHDLVIVVDETPASPSSTRRLRPGNNKSFKDIASIAMQEDRYKRRAQKDGIASSSSSDSEQPMPTATPPEIRMAREKSEERTDSPTVVSAAEDGDEVPPVGNGEMETEMSPANTCSPPRTLPQLTTEGPKGKKSTGRRRWQLYEPPVATASEDQNRVPSRSQRIIDPTQETVKITRKKHEEVPSNHIANGLGDGVTSEIDSPESMQLDINGAEGEGAPITSEVPEHVASTSHQRFDGHNAPSSATRSFATSMTSVGSMSQSVNIVKNGESACHKALSEFSQFLRDLDPDLREFVPDTWNPAASPADPGADQDFVLMQEVMAAGIRQYLAGLKPGLEAVFKQMKNGGKQSSRTPTKRLTRARSKHASTPQRKALLEHEPQQEPITETIDLCSESPDGDVFGADRSSPAATQSHASSPPQIQDEDSLSEHSSDDSTMRKIRRFKRRREQMSEEDLDESSD